MQPTHKAGPWLIRDRLASCARLSRHPHGAHQHNKPQSGGLRLGGRGREAERRVSRSCRLWAASAHSYTYLQVHRKDRQHSFYRAWCFQRIRHTSPFYSHPQPTSSRFPCIQRSGLPSGTSSTHRRQLSGRPRRLLLHPELPDQPLSGCPIMTPPTSPIHCNKNRTAVSAAALASTMYTPTPRPGVCRHSSGSEQQHWRLQRLQL